MKHELKTSVPLEYIDQYGHVNYALLPKLYERAQDAAMAERGLSFDSLQRDYGLRSFVRRMEVDYNRELLEGDEITIKTLIGVGNSSLTYDQYIERGGIQTSSFKLVVVTVNADGIKTRISDSIRNILSE